MNAQAIIAAIQMTYRGALVRAKNSDGGWVVEVVHVDCTNLGTAQFRQRIQVILSRVTNPSPPLIIWKLFTYSNEESRYLEHGTLHEIPSSFENGMHTVTQGGQDSYLDIPEFDSEIISMSNYRGHCIPALESVGSTGQVILPVQQVDYSWLEAIGGEYNVLKVVRDGSLNNRRRFIVELR